MSQGSSSNVSFEVAQLLHAASPVAERVASWPVVETHSDAICASLISATSGCDLVLASVFSKFVGLAAVRLEAEIGFFTHR